MEPPVIPLIARLVLVWGMRLLVVGWLVVGGLWWGGGWGVGDFGGGVPVAGWREGVSGVVGPLVNVVPVRLGYESGLSFERWVGVVGQWVGAARLRGRVPFERIVEAVGPGRDLSRSPLFQVFFGSEREREWGFGSVPGAVVESVGLDTGFAAVDLELVASWSGSGVRLRLDGNADLFAVATLRRLGGAGGGGGGGLASGLGIFRGAGGGGGWGGGGGAGSPWGGVVVDRSVA